jgi:hypothetical protein
VETILTYRRISVSERHIAIIRGLIAANPQDLRTEISRKVCRRFGWVQPNGTLRDMICRSLLLRLEEGGHIQLPKRQQIPQHMSDSPQAARAIQTEMQLENAEEILASVGSLRPLLIQQVRRTPAEKIYRELVQKYHYLGYTQPVGEHLKYVIYSGLRPISCISFSSSPCHIGSRDRFIGWDLHTRQRNIHLMAYNTRFLILPWVRVPHLASHILGAIARRICDDWQTLYNHPIHLLETFVDTERFAGTCYKAANWRYLGLTTGRGKNDQTHTVNRSIKAVWVYPLCADFREKLCAQ